MQFLSPASYYGSAMMSQSKESAMEIQKPYFIHALGSLVHKLV